jgi:hypothetical protein
MTKESFEFLLGNIEIEIINLLQATLKIEKRNDSFRIYLSDDKFLDVLGSSVAYNFFEEDLSEKEKQLLEKIENNLLTLIGLLNLKFNLLEEFQNENI